MNYVEMMGGLGNQIFQYVFSRYIQKNTGKTVLLHINFFEYVKYVPGATVRSFDLDKFNTKYISVNGNISVEKIVGEKDFSVDNTDDSVDWAFFRGYWQDKCFFTDVKSQILSELSLKDKYITEDMKKIEDKVRNNESVSLHIRGTDYLQGANINIFESLGFDYYNQALSYIKNNSNNPLKIYVFTDDVSHAESILKGLGDINFKIMDKAEPYQDLWLMSKMKHHIIANSSYSYWGAAMGEANEYNGITVAPKKWFKQSQGPDLYLDGWEII